MGDLKAQVATAYRHGELRWARADDFYYPRSPQVRRKQVQRNRNALSTAAVEMCSSTMVGIIRVFFSQQRHHPVPR